MKVKSVVNLRCNNYNYLFKGQICTVIEETTDNYWVMSENGYQIPFSKSYFKIVEETPLSDIETLYNAYKDFSKIVKYPTTLTINPDGLGCIKDILGRYILSFYSFEQGTRKIKDKISSVLFNGDMN
jgi:hypothetical protein